MTLEQTIMAWAGVIIALGGAAAVLWKIFSPLVKKTQQLLDALDRFTRDWFGEDGAPGRDRIPGVMERLNKLDGELSHNGGSSMKDALRRVENKLDEIDARLKEGDERMTNIEKRIK